MTETSTIEQAEIPFPLREKIASLSSALLSANPGFSTILADIHSQTKANPTYVYGLTDEEIATIISGLSRYTDVTINTGKVKGLNKKQGLLLDTDSV